MLYFTKTFHNLTVVLLLSVVNYCISQENHQSHNPPEDNQWNNDHLLITQQDMARHGAIIRGPHNAKRNSHYIELVLVIDNTLYRQFGEDLTKIHSMCKEVVNKANSIFYPLNTFVALTDVVVWNEADQIVISAGDGDATLSNFLHYRKYKLLGEHPNDSAQLLTGVPLPSNKALKGPICSTDYSGAVIHVNNDMPVDVTAAAIVHSLGHNIGMEHDTEECFCNSSTVCLMNEVRNSGVVPEDWSSCSIEYLESASNGGRLECLRNKPKHLFDGPVCGNGFVEPGEQCDCGLPDKCENTCCNASTCMLFNNATCATGECCNLETCKPKSPGYECRAAEEECDLPEFCTGESEYCPKDVFKIDGETCSRGKAYCFQGFCRTHSDQCKLLWGPSGKNSESQCYGQNIKGNRHGNCGYLRVNQSYLSCENDDILCGRLHCSHLNERLEFGMESVSILSHTFINHEGRIIPCKAAIIDVGYDEKDPGLTPNGAKCGENKMCVDQKCVSVDSLRTHCPLSSCNGNGACNSEGHCHCNVGYSLPFCKHTGAGGSVDSGPVGSANQEYEENDEDDDYWWMAFWNFCF